jgi:hypothetical protein
MVLRALADATVVIHLGFVLFVVLGGLLVARWPRVAWLHIPAVCWGAWTEFAGVVCPLTPLENWLRQQGGAPAYTRTFIEHYLVPVLYPASLTREIQVVLGTFAVLVNVGAYAMIIAQASQRRRAAAHPSVPSEAARSERNPPQKNRP